MNAHNHHQSSVEPIRQRCLGQSIIELLPRNQYEVSYSSDSHTIGFAFDAQVGVHALGTDKHQDFYRQANSFAFIPAGCDVFSESEQGGEYLRLVVSPELLSTIKQNQPSNQLVQAQSVLIAREIRKYLIENHPIEDLLVENLFDNIVTLLSTSQKKVKHALSPQQLKRLDDFIEANIDQSLSIVNLAKIFDISAGHFSRLFKSSVGVSPFDYIIQKRLTYARYFLQKTENDISHIALTCGFYSHAHMGMVFKKHLGLSPNDFRSNKK